MSWLRHNQVTLCYSEQPYLTLEGKKFPFLREQEVQYNTAKSRFFGSHAEKNKLHKLTSSLFKGCAEPDEALREDPEVDEQVSSRPDQEMEDGLQPKQPGGV